MADGRTQTEVRCPACRLELPIPLTARMVGRGQAVVALDLSAVRAHVAEHDNDR